MIIHHNNWHKAMSSVSSEFIIRLHWSSPTSLIPPPKTYNITKTNYTEGAQILKNMTREIDIELEDEEKRNWYRTGRWRRSLDYHQRNTYQIATLLWNPNTTITRMLILWTLIITNLTGSSQNWKILWNNQKEMLELQFLENKNLLPRIILC